MAGNKTLDGLRIAKVVKALSGLEGVIVRNGSNHSYVANMNGVDIRPCPIATSTHVERMVVPWVRKAMGYTNDIKSKQIYQALKTGD